MRVIRPQQIHDNGPSTTRDMVRIRKHYYIIGLKPSVQHLTLDYIVKSRFARIAARMLTDNKSERPELWSDKLSAN